MVVGYIHPTTQGLNTDYFLMGCQPVFYYAVKPGPALLGPGFHIYAHLADFFGLFSGFFAHSPSGFVNFVQLAVFVRQILDFDNFQVFASHTHIHWCILRHGIAVHILRICHD